MKLSFPFLVILIVGVCCLLPLSVDAKVFKQGVVVDLAIPCTFNGTYCSASAVCNTTIINPNGTVLVNNKPMSQNGVTFNYSLSTTQTLLRGEYDFQITCIDNTTPKSKTLTFWITQTGEQMETQDAIIYFVALIILILFLVLSIYAFTKSHQAWKKLLSFYGFYISLVAISYVVWITTANIVGTTGLLEKFFYWLWMILMFGFFPLVLCSFVLYIWLIINIKEIRTMLDRGVPEDRAYAKEVRRGLRKQRY